MMTSERLRIGAAERGVSGPPSTFSSFARRTLRPPEETRAPLSTGNQASRVWTK